MPNNSKLLSVFACRHVFKTMEPKSPLPKRPCLPGFDYAASGYYFVTLVTNFRKCILGEVINSQIELSDLGRLFEEQLLIVSQRFPSVIVDSYVIMPNHVHLLLYLKETTRQVKLFRLVNELKGRVTIRHNKLTNQSGTVWQYGYYDVVVRSERQLQSVRSYIEVNPIEWELDMLHPNSTVDGASACTTFGT